MHSAERAGWCTVRINAALETLLSCILTRARPQHVCLHVTGALLAYTKDPPNSQRR